MDEAREGADFHPGGEEMPWALVVLLIGVMALGPMLFLAAVMTGIF